jgi:hypothetical protein
VRRLVKRLRRWLRHGDSPAILMYHRIATPDVDPWGLSVSPERFAEQVETLSVRRTVLSMDAFVHRSGAARRLRLGLLILARDHLENQIATYLGTIAQTSTARF